MELPRSNLGKRIAAAAVMAPVTLAAVYYGGAAFSVFVMLLGAMMSWELDEMRKDGFKTVVIALVPICASLSPFHSILTLGGGMLLMVLIACFYSYRLYMALLGVLIVYLPCASMLYLRGEGLLPALWLMVTVWTVDIGAYAAGKTMGRHKLAPRISPGKTWEGLAGGVAAASIAGYLFGGDSNGPFLAAAGALLAVLAQTGDLMESAIKRHYGLKDSSNLIPGHGGVLDRVDGFILAAPAAVAFSMAAGGIFR